MIRGVTITVLSIGKLHVNRLNDPEGNEWVPLKTKRADGTLGFSIKEIAVTPHLPPTTPEAIKFRVIGDSKFTVILDGPRPSLMTYNSESDTSWNATPFRKPKKEVNLNRVVYLTFSLLPLMFSGILRSARGARSNVE